MSTADAAWPREAGKASFLELRKALPELEDTPAPPFATKVHTQPYAMALSKDPFAPKCCPACKKRAFIHTLCTTIAAAASPVRLRFRFDNAPTPLSI